MAGRDEKRKPDEKGYKPLHNPYYDEKSGRFDWVKIKAHYGTINFRLQEMIDSDDFEWPIKLRAKQEAMHRIAESRSDFWLALKGVAMELGFDCPFEAMRELATRMNKDDK